MAKKSGAARRRRVRVDSEGQAHIHSSFNNIIVTLANMNGDVISWSSSGKMDFKGSRSTSCYGLC